MTKRKRSKAVLASENRLLKKHHNAGVVASVLNNIIRWVGLCVIIYFLFRSIECLAGTTTTADFGLKLFAEFRPAEVVAYLFGGGGVVYGWKQRALRKTTIERLQGRIKILETSHDSERSSSGLTVHGDTHPKDIV